MGKQVKKHVCIAVCVNSMWLFICGHRMVGQGTGMGKQVRKYVCIGVWGVCQKYEALFPQAQNVGTRHYQGQAGEGVAVGCVKTWCKDSVSSGCLI